MSMKSIIDRNVGGQILLEIIKSQLVTKIDPKKFETCGAKHASKPGKIWQSSIPFQNILLHFYSPSCISDMELCVASCQTVDTCFLF